MSDEPSRPGGDRYGEVPSMQDDPVVWDPGTRQFVPVTPPVPTAATAEASAAAPASGPTPPPTPRRHVVIGPEHVGRTPMGAAPAAAAPAVAAAPSAPAQAPPAAPPPVRPRPSRSPAAPAPRPKPARPRRSPGRRVLRVLVAVLVCFALLCASLFAFGWWQFSRIDRVDVGNVLSASGNGGTNYLIVGTDSREGIAQDAPDAGAFLGETVTGARTDTIMVLRVSGGSSALLSIPRDLWVTNPVTGEVGRINSVFANGPAALIQAVEALGIPINHYLEINFVSFGKLVDAVGGITVPFEYPARDTHSGLDAPEAGEVSLDGTQALAYVRSRYYEQLVDGAWQTDPTADLGRVERQRAFLSGLMGKVTGTRNPISLVQVAGALGGGLRIDQEMTYFDALGLMWQMRDGFDPVSATLPVSARTTSGGASVLDLNAAEAATVVSQFGG